MDMALDGLALVEHLDEALASDRRHSPAPLGQQKRSMIRPPQERAPQAEVVLERMVQAANHRQVAGLAALAMTNMDGLLVHVGVGEVERDALAKAQPRRIKQLDMGDVAEVDGV